MKEQGPIGKSLYLIDHDLGGSVSGLDLVEAFKLQRNCILVTSKSPTDKLLGERLNSLGIRMIPKILLDRVSAGEEDVQLAESSDRAA